MKKEDIPGITATNFDQANAFMREYDLGQFRVSEYIKALAVLPGKGKLPTDFSIARHIDTKRTKQSARGVMMKLVRLGLAKELRETDLGFAYAITDKGEQAYTKLLQIERNWLAMWESEIDPPATDYSYMIAKKNSEIKKLNAAHDVTVKNLRAGHEETVKSLNDTIATKNRLIESQDREIERLRAEVERLKKVAGEGVNPDRVPYPL